MQTVLRLVETDLTPELLVERLSGEPGVVLLRSGLFDAAQARYSFVAARPFLEFTSYGTRCKVRTNGRSESHYGNPWLLLDTLLARCEILDELDMPFPLGGCFGYWGYELKDSLESCLTRRAVNDLELPDCHLGFHDSLVVFDHALDSVHIISTGLSEDGSRSESRAKSRCEWWMKRLQQDVKPAATPMQPSPDARPLEGLPQSTARREQFIDQVKRAKDFIRSGDIYQVNLSHRLSVQSTMSGWNLFLEQQATSPAPFASYLDCGEFQIASSSPESFLRLSGRHVRTRPIKGTRPRSSDPTEDTRLAYELQTSSKEQAELVMITDLLRNDIGRVCEFGSVQVPELFRLECYTHVQHLVSTVEGQLRADVTHLAALAACFPGGSITGAPKIRAMQVIDELEPVTRGPYTGALGYLGFNRESHLSIIIRTAVHTGDRIHFHVGAGIVADSIPEAEYDETLAKAAGFLSALHHPRTGTATDIHIRKQPASPPGHSSS